MINEYGSPIDVTEMTYLGKSSYLSAFGYEYAPSYKNVTVTNSTFRNFKYLWVINTYYDCNFEFDGCYFDNITYLARSLTITETSKFTFNNSAFMNIDPVIDRSGYTHRPNPTIDFNNNYWGNNSQPVINYMDGANVVLENIPETWIILTSEDEFDVNKSTTDGENITDYTGNVPIYTDYADKQGSLARALVIGDKGYFFTTDDETDVIFNANE